MRKVAFLVGVEEYRDKDIKRVQFAENDVLGIAEALVQLGLSPDEIVMLVNTYATKTIISSRLKKLTSSLLVDDVIYFYYAGHGFSQNDVNYITCYDTLRNDLAGTSIELQGVFKLLRDARVKQSVLFIDACQSGLPADASMRGIYSKLSDAELEAFLADAQGCICFSSCKDSEDSFSHAALKHGIWSFHVIEALSGRADLAVEKGKIVTPGSLQNYLSREVPSSVRKLRSTGDTQTPWMCGAMNRDLVIADVSHILLKKMHQKAPLVNQLKKALISSIHVENVRSLSGFIKGSHTVPKAATGATQRFIESISENEVKEILERVHNGLKQHLKYSRRDIEVSHGDGRASIITPSFDYHVEVTISENDPSKAIFHEFIENISDGRIVLSDEFNSAFCQGFNSIDFVFQNAISIEGIIDTLEELKPAGMKLTYDASCTRLEIDIDDYSASLVIEPDRLRIVVARPITPNKFLPIAEEGLKRITNNSGFASLPLLKEGESG
jgi:uncharacterized caspase-like protein